MCNLFKAGFSVIAACGAFFASAHGAAIYSASVDATLSLISATSTGTGPAEVSVDGETVLVDTLEDSSGDATSSASTTLSPATPTSLLTTPIGIELAATGEATGIGLADSFAFGDGFVLIENMSSTDSVELVFELVYDVAASVSVDDTTLEFATAEAGLTLQDDASFAGPLLDILFLADSDTPDTDFSVADTFLFSIIIDPLTFSSISLFAGVLGGLSSDLDNIAIVPVPPIAPLFGLAALVVLRRNHKRQQRKTH